MIPVWWVCVCTRVCVCAQAGGNEQQVWHLQVYRWTSLFCIMHFVRACVWVWSQTVNQGQTLEWDRQTDREGGREGPVLQPRPAACWLTRQTASIHTIPGKSRSLRTLGTSSVTVTDIWHHPVCDKVPSPFLPRHVPACERDLDLSCHLRRFVWPERPMGGVLLLPPRICRPVLWAVRPWVYPAGPWRGSSFTLRAMRLPPTWNLPPGDRYYLTICLSCDRFHWLGHLRVYFYCFVHNGTFRGGGGERSSHTFYFKKIIPNLGGRVQNINLV